MKPSLSASALKYIALAAMLLDHMAYYLSLPLPLRWVGRLAAPIFLFFVVEGFCHTRRFGRYLLRMYAVAVGMGLVNTLLARYAAGFRPDGITPQNGICATFFLLLLMLRGLSLLQQRRWAAGLALAAAPFALPLLLARLLPGPVCSLLFGTVLPSPYSCEGGVPFLLLGLLLYAFRARRGVQLGAYVLFSLGVYLLPALQGGCSVSLLLWGYYQWMMVFAALPLSCYNGARGSAPRWLFYVFYPAHVYLLWALGALL